MIDFMYILDILAKQGLSFILMAVGLYYLNTQLEQQKKEHKSIVEYFQKEIERHQKEISELQMENAKRKSAEEISKDISHKIDKSFDAVIEFLTKKETLTKRKKKITE